MKFNVTLFNPLTVAWAVWLRLIFSCTLAATSKMSPFNWSALFSANWEAMFIINEHENDPLTTSGVEGEKRRVVYRVLQITRINSRQN